ncbi:biotin/lipoyl-binding protein [Phyllobacterium sp. UNC302MFCol5.2]|uniref:site-2 protease family protein n=1 Tax=Phyllobacterium sp. UNC302MFCol5.2 TaxID=1449065 RepID=UPI00068E38B1|nr:biotin/lipoyl-binding protein [Phyllobacterium sp. UNC302MFCol5.2]
MTNPPQGQGSVVAPALRQDLRLHSGSRDSGEGHWLVYDPIAHRYHEVDERAYQILQHWRGNVQLDALAVHLTAQLGDEVSLEDLYQLTMMLDQAGLFAEPIAGWKSVYKKQQDRRRGPLSWLLHNYLFIRVPLLKPDGFLQTTLPVARLFASRVALSTIAILGLAGLFMASRQLDTFSHTFLFFFSLEGALGYAVALFFVKIFHELGHAYTAKHFGCRVPTMGIAFLVLAPVLYTDVTDTWRLQSRRQRLLVSGAGMMVELAIAAIATFLWALLPDGILKSACFFIATASWVLSLAINLSPLMRFDGYYLLSDYWRISNLQPRAFALFRWAIREFLFNLEAPCPEDWPWRRRAMIVFYALAVCIYRLGLFIGIALIVYHMTQVKMLGILLFTVEILWFVARPVANEIKVWWALRDQIAEHRRYRLSGAAAVLVVLSIMIPWPHRVEMPAVMEPVSVQRIAAPVAAQLKQIMVKAGVHVKPGDILYRLESPKLALELVKTQTYLDLALLRRARRVADQLDRNATIVIDQEIASLDEQMAGHRRLENDLTMRATVAGVIEDVTPDLHVDRWVGKGEELALVVADGGHQVRGYVPEDLVSAVQTGARGQFIPDEPLTAKSGVRLASISAGGVSALDLPYLSSTNGGAIAVNEDKEKGAVPVEAQYQFIMTTDAAQPVTLPVLRGVVRIDANPESVFSRTARRALAVLIRESGF